MQIQFTAPIQNTGLQLQENTALPQFREGGSFSAAVTGIEGKSVTFTLDNGTTFTARQENIELLHPGDTVTIEVSAADRSGMSASLKLVEVNGQPLIPDQATGAQARLLDMQILPTASNMAHAAVLDKLGVSVTAQNVTRFSQITAQFPDMTAAQSALYAASSLPITQDTAQSFLACLTSPQQAASLLQSLAQFAAENLPETAALFFALQSSLSQSVPAAPASETAAQQENIQIFPAPEGAQPPVSAAQAENTATAATQNQSGIPGQTPAMQPAAQPQPAGTAAEAATAPANAAPEAAATPAATGQQAQAPAETVSSQPQIPAAHTAAAQAGNPELPAAPQATANIQQALLAVLKNESGTQGPVLQESAAKLPEKLFRVLTSALGDAARQASSGSLRQANIVEQTGALLNQLQLGAETAPVAYLQIPFQYMERQQTAELYVMRRQNSGEALDEANATVAICLETSHIGRVEAVLTAMQNVLTIDFRVETEPVAAFLSRRLPRLYEADFPARYRLEKAGVGLIKERLTPLNAARALAPERPKGPLTGLDISI